MTLTSALKGPSALKRSLRAQSQARAPCHPSTTRLASLDPPTRLSLCIRQGLRVGKAGDRPCGWLWDGWEPIVCSAKAAVNGNLRFLYPKPEEFHHLDWKKTEEHAKSVPLVRGGCVLELSSLQCPKCRE